MANVYIEPRPKGRQEGELINDYVVADHANSILATFKNRIDAIFWSRHQGHHALVARVRHLNDKKNPDHWHSA